MSNIINITHRKNVQLISRVDHLSRACWHLSHATLWPEQSFTKMEKDKAIFLIKSYLKQNSLSAFMDFCERVVLARLQVISERSLILPLPSVWLNENYETGYKATNLLYVQLKEKRKHIPGYMYEIQLLTRYYYRYQVNPNKTSICSCRKALLQMNAYYLLPLFYRIFFYNQYL